jgi:hypothetical protein
MICGVNIHKSTLFSELEGLACSLAYELEFHWSFDPVLRQNWIVQITLTFQ